MSEAMPIVISNIKRYDDRGIQCVFNGATILSAFPTKQPQSPTYIEREGITLIYNHNRIPSNDQLHRSII